MAPGQGPRTHSPHLYCLVSSIGYENIAMVLETYIILGVCLALLSVYPSPIQEALYMFTRTLEFWSQECIIYANS